MGEAHWTVYLQDGPHTVDLTHGYWSGKRRITVDGQLAVAGGGLFLTVWMSGSCDAVSIGGHPCEVWVQPNLRTNNYDYRLVIDGRVYGPGEVNLATGAGAAAGPFPDRLHSGPLVAFLDCGEIRMGSPYNVCRIRLNLDWQPAIPASDFQDHVAASPDGRYLALVRWDTPKNEPGFVVFILDNQEQTVRCSPRQRGCCDRLWWESGFQWSSTVL